ncbi:hypothetical protein ACLOJK_025622 [Asimina triloba]
MVARTALIVSFHHQHQLNRKRPNVLANQTSCDLFSGSWVRDSSYPLYQYTTCPVIDSQFNCQIFGRPDTDYQRYRWQPSNCELPRFDGLAFLLRMRGRKVLFVGDSLGRNQWESLICMTYSSVRQSQTQFIRGDPISDYGVSISYHRALFLVDVDIIQGRRILKLGEIDGNANYWRDADILSFNSGHWWTHTGNLQGWVGVWDYIEQGGSYYSNMDRLAAFQKGMTTWARWVDSNVDISRTKIKTPKYRLDCYGMMDRRNGLRAKTSAADETKATTVLQVAGCCAASIEKGPTEWSGAVSKNCYGETQPVSGYVYAGAYPDQMRVVRAVISEMSKPTFLLDITTLSALRKDGHPSIYSGDLSPQQRSNPDRSADCSHWCLPGLPDTWNELFYTALFY